MGRSVAEAPVSCAECRDLAVARDEARAQLLALTQRAEKAEAEVVERESQCEQVHRRNDELLDERHAFKAQLARCREALEEVRDIEVMPGEDPTATWRAAVKYLQERARAALAEAPSEPRPTCPCGDDTCTENEPDEAAAPCEPYCKCELDGRPLSWFSAPELHQRDCPRVAAVGSLWSAKAEPGAPAPTPRTDITTKEAVAIAAVQTEAMFAPSAVDRMLLSDEKMHVDGPTRQLCTEKEVERRVQESLATGFAAGSRHVKEAVAKARAEALEDAIAWLRDVYRRDWDKHWRDDVIDGLSALVRR